MRLTLAGTAAGIAIALASARVLNALLYGVRAFDPLTLAAVSALVGCAALAAIYLPARRAMRIEPMIALRYE